MAAQVTLTEAVSSKPTSAKTLSVPLEMKDRSGGLVFETLLSAIRPVDRCCHRSELSRLNLTCLPYTSTSLPGEAMGPVSSSEVVAINQFSFALRPSLPGELLIGLGISWRRRRAAWSA